MDFLSESDINCLNESISENKDISFQRIKNKSHDIPYEKAWSNGQNSVIQFIDIAVDGGANEELVKFIQLSIEDDILILR